MRNRMTDKAMKYIIALLSSLILTSCSMFNSEAPYKRFFSEKENPIIQAIHDCDKDKILDMMHKGWNVNSMGKHGMSYLLYAVWEHNYDMTKFTHRIYVPSFVHHIKDFVLVAIMNGLNNRIFFLTEKTLVRYFIVKHTA